MNSETVFPLPCCKVSIRLHKGKIRCTQSDVTVKTLGVSTAAETTVKQSHFVGALLSSVLSFV